MNIGTNFLNTKNFTSNKNMPANTLQIPNRDRVDTREKTDERISTAALLLVEYRSVIPNNQGNTKATF